MIGTKFFTVEDLLGVLGGIYEYNSAGKVMAVTFHDELKNELKVSYVQVYAEEPPMVVRSKPEDPKESSSAAAYGVDPRLVPPPMSANDLAALTEQAHRG